MKKAAYPRDGPRRARGSVTMLMVSRAVGASPVKMLEMLAPPSASSPRPLERRSWMTWASLGLLATSRRPDSFSYDRKAGISALLPWSSPAWLAGVVDGSWTCHSVRVWEPERTDRVIVGRSPLRIAQRSRGADRPSTWMKTTPGPVDGAAPDAAPRDRPSRWERKAVSSPAEPSQPAKVVRSEKIHDPQNASQKLATVMPGVRARAAAKNSASAN